MALYNKYDKQTLRKKLAEETFRRVTLSFYRYVLISDVESFRDHLYSEFDLLGVLGRIYVAHEGINAQLSVPELNFDAFKKFLDDDEHLRNMDLKIAIEDFVE